MATIKFCITNNKREWNLLEEAIGEAFKHRKITSRHNKGYSQFISMQISTALNSIHIDSIPEDQIDPVKKNFEINVTDENEIKIRRLCNRLNISPAVLISKLILLPHLIPKNEKESPTAKR